MVLRQSCGVWWPGIRPSWLILGSVSSEGAPPGIILLPSCLSGSWKFRFGSVLRSIVLLGGGCPSMLLPWAVCWGGWYVSKERHNECQHPRFPSRALRCNEMIDVAHFTCQWFDVVADLFIRLWLVCVASGQTTLLFPSADASVGEYEDDAIRQYFCSGNFPFLWEI